MKLSTLSTALAGLCLTFSFNTFAAESMPQKMKDGAGKAAMHGDMKMQGDAEKEVLNEKMGKAKAGAEADAMKGMKDQKQAMPKEGGMHAPKPTK
jgi:type IV secretory pathway VirB6-like protein